MRLYGRLVVSVIDLFTRMRRVPVFSSSPEVTSGPRAGGASAARDVATSALLHSAAATTAMPMNFRTQIREFFIASLSQTQLDCLLPCSAHHEPTARAPEVTSESCDAWCPRSCASHRRPGLPVPTPSYPQLLPLCSRHRCKSCSACRRE